MKALMVYFTITLTAVAVCSCQSTSPTSTKLPANVVVSSQSKTAEVDQTKTADQAPKRDSAALTYELARKTWATNDDAISMIIMLVEGQDNYNSYQDRLNTLEAKGIVGKGWNLLPDKPVTKGAIAFMVCRATHIKGGVMMHLIPSRRYAYRELVYRGMMVRGGEFEPLTGPELVGIIGRAVRPQERL
jgi:hypothetical protein